MIKKPLPILENIPITAAGAEGQAIAKVNDLVIFVDNAIPGDIVDIQITRKKNKYWEGRAIKFHEYSSERQAPVCEHFGVCGGCKWQNMKYASQLFYKHQQVYDNLKRIGKIELPELLPIIASKEILNYRNKLEFSFSNKKWLSLEEIQNKSLSFGQGIGEISRNALGFHIPKMFDKILDINHCHLQKEPSNSIRLFIKEYAEKNNLTFFDLREQQGFLRNLIIRTSTTGELMVILSFFYEDTKYRENLLNKLVEKFPEITALFYIINTKKNDSMNDLEAIPYRGNDCIHEQMEGLKFKIGPKSFYQTNSEQAYELYQVVRNFAELKGYEIVYDLYTGTGTIAIFIASMAKKVVGIEYIASAIEDARFNAQINKITNSIFYAGDIKDVLNEDFVKENGKPDILITDPPRAGMHEEVVKKILDIEPEKVVYVSCNPASQARDLSLLDLKYRVEKIQPVDMFPHTHHVENVILLMKR